MSIFLDLMSTLGVVLPIFGVVLVFSIGITVAALWLWDRLHPNPEPRSPLADFFDSYGDSESAGAKERMDTLSRPAEVPSDHWIDKLLTKYQLGLEVDSGAGVLRLTDRKHFELKNKVMEFPVSKAVGLDEPAAKELLRGARFNFNRRARRQGIIPVKRRQGVINT